MQVETLREEVARALQDLAWDQWSQLGVSAAPPGEREERAADPEALLLFTLEVGRNDPRLFDEVLDWLALNEPLVSVHRLRNLATGATDRALVDSALSWASRSRRRERAVGDDVIATELTPLFPGLATPSGDLDPTFARHGLARTRVTPSGKSQAPRVLEPIAFAFRLRRLLGVGVRAEVMRALLTIHADWVSGRIIAASAGFAQRNVREGLTQLQEAGVIDVRTVSDDRQYSRSYDDWAALLRIHPVSELPLYYDWIPAYRALTRILRFLQTPELEALSPYLRASQARTLVEEIDADLRTLRVPPETYARFGADFWDAFVELARATIRHAREPAMP
jgi:hypothetical protein